MKKTLMVWATALVFGSAFTASALHRRRPPRQPVQQTPRLRLIKGKR
jgi:hypothetical protein